MFTGIIETLGEITAIDAQQTNLVFTIKTPFANELTLNQSIAHNGVCLSVTEHNTQNYKVTAIKETLDKTNLSKLQVGDKINLERCLQANGRFDGHIVQGHVDTTAVCEQIENTNGSWLFTFKHTIKPEFITVEKGSITINGISLTVVNSKTDSFSVAIIPYTFEHTNLGMLKKGGIVNIEFDIVGKYISKLTGAYKP